MRITDNILQEIRVLSQFNPGSCLEGIKVHHDADPDLIAATERLFNKGLITQQDGGYLTDAGIELLRHLDSLTPASTRERGAAALLTHTATMSTGRMRRLCKAVRRACMLPTRMR